MKTCEVVRYTLENPGDVSALKAAIDSGSVAPESIRAVIGKMEGNGGVNDFTRAFFTQSLFYMLADYLPGSVDVLKARIPCVLSGGTEGVLSPHYTIFCVSEAEDVSNLESVLALGSAMSRVLEPDEIGLMAHVAVCRDAVLAAMADADLSAEEVSFVQVKCPAISAVRAQALIDEGKSACASNSGQIMALSRVAGAWGVGVALGELSMDQLSDDAMLKDFSLLSSRASISSGLEIDRCEVVVLGNSNSWGGNLQIAASPMTDALDLSGPFKALEKLGIDAAPPLSQEDAQRIRSVLVKCEPARSGKIRGNRHTMLDDTDIDPQRHIRGAVGGMVASVVGDGRIFVSGGAEHQGPDEGGIVAVIAEVAG
ncbi:MAG: ring-opening amidohydrolase [Opitutales bacterium]